MDKDLQQIEVWQRGPVNGVTPLLQPIAHALLQAKEEVNFIQQNLKENLLWEQPAGLASPGFHLQHLTGVLDRLFTYAREEQLSLAQLQRLSEEQTPRKENLSVKILVDQFNHQVDKSILQLKETSQQNLTAERLAGRKFITTTLIGLLVHGAEHTMRHVGQLMVTVKFLQYQNKD